MNWLSSTEQANGGKRREKPITAAALAVVTALLAGLLIWSVARRVETTVDVAIMAGPDRSITVYIPDEAIDSIEVGQTVRMREEGAVVLSMPDEVSIPDGENGAAEEEQTVQIGGADTLTAIASQPVETQSVLEEYILENLGLVEVRQIWPAEVDGGMDLVEGVYPGEIVTGKVSLISLLFG